MLRFFLYLFFFISLNVFAFASMNENLVAAAQRGDEAGVRNALAQGADINYRDLKHGNTALIWAVVKFDLNFVRFLVDRGANINLANKMHATPFYFAYQEKKIEILKYLINKKVITSQITLHHFIFNSMRDNNIEIASLLIRSVKNLQTAKVDNVFLIDDLLLNSLHFKRTGIAKLLIQLGARINSLTAKTSLSYYTRPYTPLMMAADNDLTEMAAYLISKGANVNAINPGDDNSTPLIYAVGRGNLELIKILIKHRANVNAITKSGWTPLNIAKRYATRSGSAGYWKDIVRVLKQAGARETRMPFVREM